MTYRNHEDVASQLQAAGLILNSVKNTQGGTAIGDIYVESVRSIRCDVANTKKRQSGAYWLHELRLDDGIWITGAYWTDHGNAYETVDLTKTCEDCGHSMSLKARACPSCGGKKAKAVEITPEQKAAHAARMAENKRQAQIAAAAENDRAAAWADAVWRKSREIHSPDEHDYLLRKQLKSAHGARVLDNNDGIILEGAEKEDYAYLARFHGALVVPMLDAKGRRRGLQFILSREKHKDLIASRDGRDKEYWPRGLGKAGLHYIVGGNMHKVGLIAEGFATAASLSEACNQPVAVAFDAGNIGQVGNLLWTAHKKRIKLLYCADDDAIQHCTACKKPTLAANPACGHCGEPHRKANAGIERAREAAQATSGAWIAPVFAERPTNRKGPTDYNDLRCLEGALIVGAQIAEKLAALDWTTPTTGYGVNLITGEGGRKLAMLDPEQVADRFSPVWSTDDVYYFDHQERVICAKQSLVARMTRHGWDQVTVTPQWQAKPEVAMDKVDFDPSETDPDVVYNLWGGWHLPPPQPDGSCRAIIGLLRHLCSHQADIADELFDWIIKWMAYPLQNPGAKMQTAILMHGGQGAGKNTVFNNLLEIYGQEYAVEFGPKQLEKRFNALFSKKLLAIGNEIVASRDDLYHVKGQIKHMITERRWVVEAKNKDERWERNACNFIFLSNELRPAAIDKGDRRHCVIWTPDTPAPDHPDYAAYKVRVDEANIERKQGGAAALHDYLMAVDLTGFDEATWPPMTNAKRDLIEDNLDSRERFWALWRKEEVGGLPCVPCKSEELYAAYRAWAMDTGIGRSVAQHSLLAYVRKQAGAEISQHRYMEGIKHVRSMIVFPYPADPPPNQTRQQWLGTCIAEFSEALSKYKDSK